MDYQLKDGISLTGIENDDVNAGLVEKLEAELVLVASRDGGADVQLKDEAKNFFSPRLLFLFPISIPSEKTSCQSASLVPCTVRCTLF